MCSPELHGHDIGLVRELDGVVALDTVSSLLAIGLGYGHDDDCTEGIDNHLCTAPISSDNIYISIKKWQISKNAGVLYTTVKRHTPHEHDRGK